MSYFVIDNFAAGLDTRKSPLTSPPGVLVILEDAVITPGGEVEKRKAFVKEATIAGTFGLASTESTLHVFTRDVDPAVLSLPSVVATTPLVAERVPNSSITLEQIDYDTFDGLIYLACADSAGVTQPQKNPHYYGSPKVETEGSGKGYYIRTYQSKIYSVFGKYLNFSAVDDPDNWTTGTGAGFINLSLQDADSEFLTSIEVYYDKLAIFSSEATQLWAVDPDPLQNTYEQLLRGTGTTAPRSSQQYGSGDVLFLSASGIRSVRARDASNSAAVSDIGSPVDKDIQDIRFDEGIPYSDDAIAVLEPVVGRFWMVFPTQILVLSYFPGPKITAWSRFRLAFTVEEAVTCNGKIFLRAGDDLWVYGGDTGESYDNCGVAVRLPYLDAKKPGHRKMFEGLDATVVGTWRIAVSYDFNNPDNEETVATINQPTWNDGRLELQGFGSHVSLRFYNDDDKYALLSNVAIHFKMAEDED
jgi:hypothetical protein